MKLGLFNYFCVSHILHQQYDILQRADGLYLIKQKFVIIGELKLDWTN